MQTIGSNIKSGASTAYNYSKESAISIKQSAEEGTLGEKTANQAKKTGAMLGSIGQSLFGKVQSFMGNDNGKEPEK